MNQLQRIFVFAKPPKRDSKGKRGQWLRKRPEVGSFTRIGSGSGQCDDKAEPKAGSYVEWKMQRESGKGEQKINVFHQGVV